MNNNRSPTLASICFNTRPFHLELKIWLLVILFRPHCSLSGSCLIGLYVFTQRVNFLRENLLPHPLHYYLDATPIFNGIREYLKPESATKGLISTSQGQTSYRAYPTISLHGVLCHPFEVGISRYLTPV